MQHDLYIYLFLVIFPSWRVCACVESHLCVSWDIDAVIRVSAAGSTNNKNRHNGGYRCITRHVWKACGQELVAMPGRLQ